MKATNRSKNSFAVVFCLLVASVISARGQQLSVPNFSFEQPDVGDNQTANPIPGWTLTLSGGEMGLFDPSDVAFPGTTGDNSPLPGTADGGQYGYSNVRGVGATNSFTSGTIAFTSLNAVYTLTVALGNRLDLDPGTVSIQLLLNNTTVAASFTTTGAAIPEGTFTDFSTSFTSMTAGDSLQVRLVHTGTSNLNQSAYDNVRVETTAVPEPSVGVMLAAGFGLLMATLTMRRPRWCTSV